jgi:hypothetical protein
MLLPHGVRSLVVVALAVSVAAQTPPTSPPTQDELLAAELASPFLQMAPWLLDWDEALAKAKKEQRLLFAYFTTVNH